MTLLRLGFLPSFLLAGLSASLLMLMRIIGYHCRELLPICYDPTNWHSQEMLFGYAVAVIALFLLTCCQQLDQPSCACREISCGTCRLMAFRTNLSLLFLNPFPNGRLPEQTGGFYQFYWLASEFQLFTAKHSQLRLSGGPWCDVSRKCRS